MATAVGVAFRQDAAGATTVVGDGNRVAGTGAHHNDFGDRLPPAAEPRTGTPSTPPAPGAPSTTAGGVRVHGNQNRVAGSHASHNRFGDGAAPADDEVGEADPDPV
ncbi:hypothetical protein ABZ915_07265 [Streptomyces sp. NPDC046915]|uniref:hypothetical protein n=1 Tax=Streptomyces sp. NPDC046915 TaxID=3155257 RepID=UPI0033DBD76F